MNVQAIPKPAAPPALDQSAKSGAAAGYSIYALAVLVVAYVLAFVDRQILNLLVEPLKHDMSLSDLQVSLLQGPAFALFLSIAGLPIGRLIDTRRRVTILSCGIVAWSLATAACGLARGYGLLLLCRIGVGAGESTMTPSAYSLIGDWFSSRRMGLAAGVYSMGAYLGSGLALILGGAIVTHITTAPVVLPLIGELKSWQAAFLAVGAMGAPVAWWAASLKEPRRAALGSLETAPNWLEVLAYFQRNGGAALVCNGAVGFSAMAMAALFAWLPSTLIRHFHMTSGEVGRDLGLIVVIAGMCGTLSAGLLGDVLRARGFRDGRLLVLGGGALCAAPLAAMAPVASNAQMALVLIAPMVFFITLAVGSGPASLQEITPNRLRGVQHALAVLMVNLLGVGVGPVAVAVLTDHVLRDEHRVGEAVALAAPIMLGLAALCALAGRGLYRRALPKDL